MEILLHKFDLGIQGDFPSTEFIRKVEGCPGSAAIPKQAKRGTKAGNFAAFQPRQYLFVTVIHHLDTLQRAPRAPNFEDGILDRSAGRSCSFDTTASVLSLAIC
jgi:hypothetical protein